MENTHNFIMPRTNLMGVGALKDLPTLLLSWKLKKALIVTDKNIISLGYAEMIETILKSLFISYDIFDGVLHPNPTVSFVQDGLSYFHKGINMLKRDYAFIISIGGGTNHDCAKAIAILATNGRAISDYEGYNKVTKPVLPQIAINTTAGSGSEVSSFTIIADESRKVKMTIGDPEITPFISVNDPMFMSTMPREVTASSGIDVVVHAIESYISTEASPITDHLALGALKLAFDYLDRAYNNGNDLEAREQMMYAAAMAGMAFNNAGLGLTHAMAHQLGGFYTGPHGVYNGVLLPYVIEFNCPSVPEDRMMKISETIGQKAGSKGEAMKKIHKAIRKLCTEIGIPEGLKQMGVAEGVLEELSQNALKDIITFTNPRQASREDIINMFKNAL
ncbi:iron-containing alcohol dehydrogenase [Candidatus Formimonas warabiya]|uniref:L-threonine dehydrogenase n=1 Tax=Formimonas warabiya TaxID=1761012 RepID=A0A3G1KUY4_FORW1|nr:iron-containing alcohol dehydrogenase [Candidatus Formimonas warabiya]ATW26220.1 L-threonine dehydrogenase [Candidatus Formimonas warabiya]